MGKGFGADLASAHALNAVVTMFEDFSLLRGMRPNASKAISLELHVRDKKK